MQKLQLRLQVNCPPADRLVLKQRNPHHLNFEMETTKVGRELWLQASKLLQATQTLSPRATMQRPGTAGSRTPSAGLSDSGGHARLVVTMVTVERPSETWSRGETLLQQRAQETHAPLRRSDRGSAPLREHGTDALKPQEPTDLSSSSVLPPLQAEPAQLLQNTAGRCQDATNTESAACKNTNTPS